MTRIKIDLINGMIDVEGEESFVREIYNEYKDKLQNIKLHNDVVENKPSTIKNIDGKHKVKSSVKGNAKKSERYDIVKDLDLAPADKQTLKDFYNLKKPDNAYERNVVFTYYLEKIAGIKEITLDHIFTCYDSIPGIKTPIALLQNIRETSSIKGYIGTADSSAINTTSNNIIISIKGKNFVENDLPATTISKE